MTLIDIRNILRTTNASNWIHSPELGAYTFFDDPQLRIQERDSSAPATFQENWATSFPDPAAFKVVYDVFYNSSWIKTVTLVSVDGGRATIPMPTTPTSKTIDLEDYIFARIVSPDNLDEYIFNKAGFTVPGASGYTETEYYQM